MHQETSSGIKTLSFIVIAICLYMALGLMIKGKIDTWKMARDAVYMKALHIETDDMYRYAADTGAGNAYAYGEMSAIDSVSVPELEGTYISIKRELEEYREHTRLVSVKDSEGNIRTETETYWSWDVMETRKWDCEKLRFKGLDIQKKEVSGIPMRHIKTVKLSYYKRYVFKGASDTLTGTLFGNMTEGTVKSAEFHEGKNIDEAVKSDTDTNYGLIFMIIWILMPVAIMAIKRIND